MILHKVFLSVGFFVGMQLLCMPTEIFAQQKDPIKISVVIEVDGFDEVRTIYCLKTKPGNVKKRNGKKVFTAFADEIKTLKKTGASKSKLSMLSKLRTAGIVACADEYENPAPAPTVLPTAAPTNIPSFPTATPAPQYNFDANGDATEKGKLLFGIPTYLPANITRGKGIYNSYCSGCHGERTNYAFDVLRINIKRSPMLFDETEIPDQTLADLTAYFNRFRMG